MKSSRLLLSLAGLACLALPICAQTALSRTALYTEVDTLFGDSGATAITPADLRQSLKNIVASAQNFTADGTAVVTSGSYANPAWITSLAWSKLSSVPTSLSLLGITNGAALDTIGANGGSYYLSRSNHTGAQAISTVTGLQTALDGKEPALGNPASNGYVLSSTTGGTRSWVAMSGGGGTWGSITGTLSSQTDLQSALDGKLGTSATAADVNPAGTSIAAALAGKAATSHTHTASQISDSTATGRSVLTAADAAAARTAIGAGTSSFDGAYSSLSGTPTLGDAAAKNTGTGSGEVAAGNHTHSGVYEPALGNPASNGYVLSSTTGGTRSWVAMSGGGAEKWDCGFDGQGQVLASDVKVYRAVTASGTLASAALVADASGSITITVKRYTPSGGSLGSATTLGTVALSSAQHNRDTTLSGWTKSVTAGDVLEISTGGTIATVTRLSVNLAQ